MERTAGTALIQNPLFLVLVTTEPNYSGQIVRVLAQRPAMESGGVKTLDQRVRGGRLTMAQARLTGLTNAELDHAPKNICIPNYESVDHGCIKSCIGLPEGRPMAHLKG